MSVRRLARPAVLPDARSGHSGERAARTRYPPATSAIVRTRRDTASPAERHSPNAFLRLICGWKVDRVEQLRLLPAGLGAARRRGGQPGAEAGPGTRSPARRRGPAGRGGPVRGGRRRHRRRRDPGRRRRRPRLGRVPVGGAPAGDAPAARGGAAPARRARRSAHRRGASAGAGRVGGRRGAARYQPGDGGLVCRADAPRVPQRAAPRPAGPQAGRGGGAQPAAERGGGQLAARRRGTRRRQHPGGQGAPEHPLRHDVRAAGDSSPRSWTSWARRPAPST